MTSCSVNNLYIIGEHHLRVSHCLVALPGVELSQVKRVYSHPQALAQCEASLSALGITEVIATSDTAGSARQIRDQGLRDAAAIASARAAENYGLAVLRTELEDDKANYTRFLCLSRQPLSSGKASAHGAAKTSVAFAGRNEPGLLFRCLAAFSLRGIDLNKIESRPLRGVPWDYVFYLDFSGDISERRCQRAVEQLEEMTTFLRVFGSYPRAQLPMSS